MFSPKRNNFHLFCSSYQLDIYEEQHRLSNVSQAAEPSFQTKYDLTPLYIKQKTDSKVTGKLEGLSQMSLLS